MNPVIALRPLSPALVVTTLAALAACSSPPMKDMAPTASAPAFMQDKLPSAVQVPAGHRVAIETVGRGDITYECRAKADAAGQFEWTFVGPEAKLLARNGANLGRYFGPPATWAMGDGSAITGSQLAVSPAQAGSIPLQLVKANPASGGGSLQGVAYIQRVATQGGVAPAKPCNGSMTGAREVVAYQADYIFWKPL
jgi:hypothetical protein